MKNLLKKILKPFKPIIKNIIYFCKYDFEEVEKERIFRYTDKIIEDCVYELEEDKKILKKLNILDEFESIDKVLKKPKSFLRIGDGEIKIIKGIDQPFQKYDKKLANRLVEVLECKDDDLYIAINRAYYHTPLNWSYNNRRFYRIYSSEYRRFFNEHCSEDIEYLDAGFLCAYYRFSDEYDYETHYQKMKELFKDKKIALVCGKGIDQKFDFDVFDLAKEKIVIYGPTKNAFQEYDSILDEVKSKVPKDYIVCAILGMTAKILVYDLTNLGYMAWDIGHLAKDYDAYMKKMDKTKENADKFWDPD